MFVTASKLEPSLANTPRWRRRRRREDCPARVFHVAELRELGLGVRSPARSPRRSRRRRSRGRRHPLQQPRPRPGARLRGGAAGGVRPARRQDREPGRHRLLISPTAFCSEFRSINYFTNTLFSFIVYSSPLRFMSNNNKRQRNHTKN